MNSLESMYSSSGVSSTGSLLLSGEDGSGGLIGGPLGPTGGLIALESYLGQHPFPQQTIVINGIDPFEDDPIQVCVSTLTSPKHYTTLNIVFRRPYLKTSSLSGVYFATCKPYISFSDYCRKRTKAPRPKRRLSQFQWFERNHSTN